MITKTEYKPEEDLQKHDIKVTDEVIKGILSFGCDIGSMKEQIADWAELIGDKITENNYRELGSCGPHSYNTLDFNYRKIETEIYFNKKFKTWVVAFNKEFFVVEYIDRLNDNETFQTEYTFVDGNLDIVFPLEKNYLPL